MLIFVLLLRRTLIPSTRQGIALSQPEPTPPFISTEARRAGRLPMKIGTCPPFYNQAIGDFSSACGFVRSEKRVNARWLGKKAGAAMGWRVGSIFLP